MDNIIIRKTNQKRQINLNQTFYWLNDTKTKSLTIGLNSEDKKPIIMIGSSKKTQIILNETEWNALNDIKDVIIEYFNDDSRTLMPILISDFLIKGVIFKGVKRIKIQNRSCYLYLTQEIIERLLFNSTDIINNNIKIVSNN